MSATPVVEELEQDTPVVKELKDLDDRCLKLTRERDQVLEELQKAYTAKQAPLLKKRADALADSSLIVEALKNDKVSNAGTPACPGFWAQSLANHPEIADMIEEVDFPVLEHLTNVVCEDVDVAQDASSEVKTKAFRVTFEFAENPYFTNRQLTKEYRWTESNPYYDETEVREVVSSEINWKPNMDVTVGPKKSKKNKKSAAVSKAAAGESKLEPRASFFRVFFRSLSEDDAVPADVDLSDIEATGRMFSEERIIRSLLVSEYTTGTALRDEIIPFAIRWYTGEALPEGYGEDETDLGDESDESSFDDEDLEEILCE